ncbi:MAG: hypothetical protein MUF72_17485 [Elainella sp. Prado103]|jgi:hypothetical protein|nr:hypothetical protein [Elainella sp. Prado103]
MSTGFGFLSASGDNNNSFASAQYIGRLGTDLDISGRLGNRSFMGGFFVIDQVDYFLFEVDSRRNVVISNDDEEVTVRLYDDQRRLISNLSEDSYGGDYARDRGFAEGLALSLPEGFYYLRVSNDGDLDDYEIDFDAAIDSDYSLSDARPLEEINCSRRLQGRVGELDFGDSYQFRPGRPGTFTLTQTATSPTVELQLYDEDRDLIDASTGRIQESLDDDQDYYLRVSAEDNSRERNYTITLTPNPSYQGTNGRDRLQGCADDEKLEGLQGDDRLLGQKGNDQLLGGAGDDQLEGGNGDDLLNGGRGRDILFGGKGRDRFVLLGNNNGDRIRDFQDGIDRLDLPDRIPLNSVDILQKGQNTVLQAGKNEIAVLVGVAANQITAIDFI